MSRRHAVHVRLFFVAGFADKIRAGDLHKTVKLESISLKIHKPSALCMNDDYTNAIFYELRTASRRNEIFKSNKVLPRGGRWARRWATP